MTETALLLSEMDSKPTRPVWHTEAPDEVAERLGTDPHGLTRQEAHARLAREGPNQLPEAPPTSRVVVLLHQFRSPLIYILLAATDTHHDLTPGPADSLSHERH